MTDSPLLRTVVGSACAILLSGQASSPASVAARHGELTRPSVVGGVSTSVQTPGRSPSASVASDPPTLPLPTVEGSGSAASPGTALPPLDDNATVSGRRPPAARPDTSQRDTTQGPRPLPAIVTSVTDTVVLDSMTRGVLDDINAHGWNPTTNGLYINWLETDPGSVDLPSGDRSLHDALTDLRDVVNMSLYERRHPTDNSQQAAIIRLTTTLKVEFKGYASDKGWVYWQFLQLADLTGDAYWSNEARYFANHLSKSVDPATGVAHGPLTASTGAGAPQCADGYRVDHDLESGLVLVDAAHRFATPAWDAIGAREVSVVTAHALSSSQHLYARIVCQGQVWDAQAKAGEQADEALAYLHAGEYTANAGYLNAGAALLDALAASGLHDAVNGGFFFALDVRSGAVDPSYKEARQLTLLTAAQVANRIFAGRYRGLQTEMTRVAVRMFVASPCPGYLHQQTPGFGLYTSNGRTVDWVTSEADGIALEAIQSLL